MGGGGHPGTAPTIPIRERSPAMSLFAALNSATAGLRTVQTNVKLVSDNIAQANDPNRTRHTAQQSVDASGQVISTTYRREVDKALMAPAVSA